MNYTQWAEEYEQQAKHLNEYIKGLREEKKNCTAMYMVEELNKRINTLYTMYLESKHTARMLRNRAEEGIRL
ncbi:MAG: hypothetical protein U0M12_03890 [Acutalibacteraceae bacterium]|nr:hypothetical protein [Acutalibacteraceae bacterium]